MANKRNTPGYNIQDTGSIANNQYNEKSGAQKQIDVGPVLLPLPNASTGTTDASTIKPLPSAGRSLAIYNNSSSLASVTVSTSGTQASKASGVIDTGTGAVGIPCVPNAWTYVSCGDATFVITSTSNLLVFLIDDNSMLVASSR